MTDATILAVVPMVLTAIGSTVTAVLAYLANKNIKNNTTMTAKIEEQTNGGFAHLREQLANAQQIIIGLKHEVATLKSDVVQLTVTGPVKGA